ncbi:MAG: LytTR family transcriptional regulator [Gelidibacter sp.]
MNKHIFIFVSITLFALKLRSQNEVNFEIDTLLHTAESFYKTNQDSALYYSEIAYNKALKLNKTAIIAKTITYKSTYLISKKRYDDALDLLSYNLKNKTQILPKDVGITYTNLGAIYALREQRDLALTNYLNAIDIFTELKDYNQLARNYLNIGVIYENTNKLKQSDFFYDKSLEYSKLAKNKAITSLHNDVKEDHKTNFDTKIKISLSALKTIKNPKESRLAAVIYHDMSKNYIDNKQYENAINSAQKAIEIKNAIGYGQNLDFSYFIIGKSEVRLKHYDEGIKNLEKAISLSEKRTLKPLMYDMLILAYKNKGDYKKAFDVSEKLSKIKDSINLFQENEHIAKITAQFETEKQAKEILELQQENQKKALVLSQQNEKKWRLISLVLLLLFVSVWLFNQYIKSLKKVKQVVQEKESIEKKVEKPYITLNNKSKVYLKELKYIKSDGNYLEFYTQDKKLTDRNKLKTVLNELPPNFIQIHRSYIINKNYISSINSTSLLVDYNIEIPISRTFKKNL